MTKIYAIIEVSSDRFTLYARADTARPLPGKA